MKKLFHLFCFLIIANSSTAQTFRGISDMFEYALHHFMTIYPDSNYYSYFSHLGEPYYVAVSLPDSCVIEETFPHDKFPNVIFCSEDEIPLKLRLRAQCVNNKRKRTIKTPVMHLILYRQNGSMFVINISDVTIHRIKGKVERIGTCDAGCRYKFEQQPNSNYWNLYKIEKCGVKYRYPYIKDYYNIFLRISR